LHALHLHVFFFHFLTQSLKNSIPKTTKKLKRKRNMNSKSLTCCLVFLLYTNPLSSTSSSSLIHLNSTTSILNVTLPNSLSQSLENFALKTLTNQHHTGALYQAILPENLSGIEVSVVRLTGKSLWNSGAKFSNVLIPARVLDVSDQGSVKEISLRMKNPVEISFRDLPKGSDEKMLSGVRCVSFKAQAKDKESAHVSRMVLPGVCYGSSHGDYSVIEPLENDNKKAESWWTWWWLWVVGFVIGFGVLGILGVVITYYSMEKALTLVQAVLL
ncbi:unnamed protein product, partial [Thlaspi arvense]